MITVIAAVAENNVIGNNNSLIWHISEDLKHFKELTLGHPVIMGRKTYQSIGKPLPGRKNIVITRNTDFTADGCTIVNSLDEALIETDGNDSFIIGGADIYRQALPVADVLEITRVYSNYEGDTYFPEIAEEWKETERIDFDKGKTFEYPFSFIKYTRKL